MCGITTRILFYCVPLTASFPAFGVPALIPLMAHNAPQDNTRFQFWVEVITLLKQHALYFTSVTSYIIAPTMSSCFVTWLYRHAVKYWNPRTSVVCRPRVLLWKSISVMPNKINHWKWDAYFFRAYGTALDKWEYLFHYLLWFFHYVLVTPISILIGYI